MLQLKALKNPVPLKENTLDLNCLLTSPSLEAHIIPVLQVDSTISKVTMLFEDKLPHQKYPQHGNIAIKISKEKRKEKLSSFYIAQLLLYQA
jgi:Ni,Fe-hydrogenase I large subunit